jgi:hypothetical protein
VVVVPRYRGHPQPSSPLSVRRRRTRLVAGGVALVLGTAVVLVSLWMEGWDRILEAGRLMFIAPNLLGGWKIPAEYAVYLRQVGGGGLGVGVAILVGDWLKQRQTPARPPS